MPELDKEQRKIIRLIRREGRKIADPHLRRVYERAAVQTGLVESGLRNLPGGDKDSAGWRQERASLYANPTNLRQSIRRFRQEVQQQYDPGEKSYEVAAQVQRPREDLRGRYREEAGAAARILRGAPNPAGGVEGSGPSYRTIPGVDNSTTRRELMQGYFSNHDPNALLQLKASLDSAQDTPSRKVRIASNRPGPVTRGTGKRGKSKVAEFDGKPVLAKFLPELEWARKHGWKGTVTSGVRTKQEQLAAAKRFGLQHYGPAGPLGSNHVKGHRGAVDVSDPDSLEEILRRYPGKRRLRRGMADDPVHFSPTGH